MTFKTVRAIQKNMLILFLLITCIFTAGTAKEAEPQTTESAPSIFFLIDHSGSMFNAPAATDQWGYRFIVTRDFIDTVMAMCPEAEVGIAVFRQYLYFDPVDDARFVQCPEQDTGAYLPLFKLDSSYAPDGKMGYEILKWYLETDTVVGLPEYVDLVYIPTNIALNNTSTNINAAFDAARHAMLASSHPKENQYIIFLSDGEATWPDGPDMNNYVQGTNVPTTFTVFFTQGNNPPQALVEMTTNIQANGYSTSNPLSNLWAFFNNDYDSLLTFLIENILGTIVDDKVPELIPYPSPTYQRRPTLTWHVPQVPGTSYTIQIAQTSNFVSPIVNVPIADTTYTPQIDLPYGTIYWRVKSDISTWSYSSSFVILDNRVPVLIPHESPTEQLQPTLTWHKPPGAVTAYTIQISASPSFDTTIIEAQANDTFYTCQAPLPVGTIYWRVRGDDSDYSPASSFIIKDNRIPKIIPYVPDITTDTLPVLYWHSVPTATSYTIQISDTADFSTVLFSVPVADTAYTPSAPLPKGNIYWRVKSNLVDIWSDADHFYIQSGDVPFLIRYNGRKVATAKPAFTWHPVATATSYRILIANNNAFTNAITVPMTDTTYIPQVGLAKGFWYWKVSCSINPENYSTCDSLEIDTTVGVIPGIVTSGVSNISLVPHKGGIKVRLPEGISGDVCLDIFDIKGRVVYTITQNSIVHKELVWEYKDTSGKNVSSGIYLIRVTYGNKTFSYKVPVSR